MKWFDKWFAKKCKQAWENENKPQKEEINIGLARPRRANPIASIDVSGSLNSQGTQFTLYNANGGTVVELRNYDPMHDRLSNSLYVIPSDKDLGEQLGHIVTMEALKR